MPVRYHSFRLTLLRARMLISNAFLLVVLSIIPHLLAQETQDKLPSLTGSYWSVWYPGKFTPQRGVVLEMEASETRLRTPKGRSVFSAERTIGSGKGLYRLLILLERISSPQRVIA